MEIIPYVLVVILNATQPTYSKVTMQEFSSKATCEIVQKEFLKHYTSSNWTGPKHVVECYPK